VAGEEGTRKPDGVVPLPVSEWLRKLGEGNERVEEAGKGWKGGK
jgi:hypothetical protein